MPGIGIGEKSEISKIPGSVLNRPFERGVKRTVVDGLRRRERVPDGKGKGVKTKETPQYLF